MLRLPRGHRMEGASRSAEQRKEALVVATLRDGGLSDSGGNKMKSSRWA